MREYVLFVILIFIPIGLVLYHFLRREGLPKKDINIILVLALLIIFSFPICMERLGIYFSLVFYLLIIGALVAYLLRIGESPYFETAFASLRNLRQRSELIFKTEPDLTVMNYEQLSEMPLDRLEGMAGQGAETIQSAKAEDVEGRPRDIESAAAIDILEDLASEPEAFRTEAKSVEEITREAEERAADETAGHNIAAAITDKLVEESAEETAESLNEPIELQQTPEPTADELVEEMVARLAAKIEAMPETLPQVRDIEGLAEEHAELAAVVEIVKDVIAEAAVKIETVPAQEMFKEIVNKDTPETLEIPEAVNAEEETAGLAEEAETAINIEIAEDITIEAVVKVETAPAEEILEETATEEVPEILENPETVATEEDTAVLTVEAETAINVEIAEELITEAVVEAEATPAEEILEETAAEKVPEILENPETVAAEEDTTVLGVETETADNIDIAENITTETVVKVETAPAEEIVEEAAAEEVPETLENPETVAAEEETAALAEETETAADLEVAEDITPETIVQVEAAPVGEIVEKAAAEEVPETLENPETVGVEQETTALAEEAETAVDLVIAEDIVTETVVEAEAVPINEIEEAGALQPEAIPTEEMLGEVTTEDALKTMEVPDTVTIEPGTETVAASDIEMAEEAIPGADDVQLEVSLAGEIAEEEPALTAAEVKDTPEPTMVVEDIEALSEELEAPEIPEAGAELAVVNEGIMKESLPGEDVAEDLAESMAEIEEVHDLSAISEEIEAQPEAQPEAMDVPQEADNMEAAETSPGEAAGEADGHAETALADQDEVYRWVDMAFHYKTIGDIPAAIEFFVQVWNKVESDELRYLITMELVDLYKECGYYNYAEQVLGNYLELGGHKSDIIYEINRQLNAIRFLATELTRLGLSGAPWAQVPRWIRMELEDALNQ